MPSWSCWRGAAEYLLLSLPAHGVIYAVRLQARILHVPVESIIEQGCSCNEIQQTLDKEEYGSNWYARRGNRHLHFPGTNCNLFNGNLFKCNCLKNDSKSYPPQGCLWNIQAEVDLRLFACTAVLVKPLGFFRHGGFAESYALFRARFHATAAEGTAICCDLNFIRQ